MVSPDTKITVDGVNAAVTGELKEIDYPEFSNDPSETHGYFFPLSVDKKYQGHTIGVFSSSSGNKKTSTDLNWVLKVKDENTKYTITDETPDLPMASSISRISAAPMSASSPVTIMELTFKGATFENKEEPEPEVTDATVETCKVADKAGVNNAGLATIKSFTKVEAGDQYEHAHTLVTIEGQLAELKQYQGANKQTAKWIPVVMTFTKDGKPVTDTVTHPYSEANGIDLVPATDMMKSGSGNVAVEWVNPEGNSARENGTDVVKYTFDDGSAVYVRYKFVDTFATVTDAKVATKEGVVNAGKATVTGVSFVKADSNIAHDHNLVTISGKLTDLADSLGANQETKKWIPVALTVKCGGKDLTASLATPWNVEGGIDLYDKSAMFADGDSSKVAVEWVDPEGNAAGYPTNKKCAEYKINGSDQKVYVAFKFEAQE